MRKFVVVIALAMAAVANAADNVSKESALKWFAPGIYVGGNPATSTNKLTRVLGNSATINFTSQSVGKQESSGITVTGAKVSDPCFVGVPAAAGALPARYWCYVSAADTVKVVFEPNDVAFAAVALVSASPSTQTATVSTGSVCSCAPNGTTAAIAAAGCAASVTGTTLTVTGPNTVTTTVVYTCAAPVDPASGTFFVRINSSQ